MIMFIRLTVTLIIASCLASNAGCASTWPFSSGPKDIRVASVSKVDFKDQPQLDWNSPKPRPSVILTRIEFTTNMDLLAFSKDKDYNIGYIFGPCTKDGVKDTGLSGGYVYSGDTIILPATKQTPEYAKVIAKGPPFTYQVYATKAPPSATAVPMCLTLSGGSMLGGKVKSNVAVAPKAIN
jgi:hypothetical protein